MKNKSILIVAAGLVIAGVILTSRFSSGVPSQRSLPAGKLADTVTQAQGMLADDGHVSQSQGMLADTGTVTQAQSMLADDGHVSQSQGLLAADIVK